MGGSYHNLAALASAQFSDARQAGYRSSSLGAGAQSASAVSLDSNSGRNRCGGRLGLCQAASRHVAAAAAAAAADASA